jgi:hypothetical protein
MHVPGAGGPGLAALAWQRREETRGAAFRWDSSAGAARAAGSASAAAGAHQAMGTVGDPPPIAADDESE